MHSLANDGCSPLYVSCRYGHYKCASALIDKHANVNQVDNYGHSALIIACFNGHYDCVSLLLDNGAHVNRIAKNGLSALYAACASGHHRCAALLLTKGANVNVKNEADCALQITILMGHIRIVFHLLENGAEVTEAGKHAAVVGNSVKALALVLRRVGFEHINANNSGGRLLRLARHLKRSDIESFLRENGASDDGTPSNYDSGIFGILQTRSQEIYNQARGERKQLRRCDFPNCDRDVPMEQLKKCSKCHEFWYCGKEHQQSHWKEHKAMCIKLRLEV